MLYPALVVVLLGSQVISVMNAQRSVETMESRYTLKMRKLDELIVRAREGEKVDVKQEMQLVNKQFDRSGAGARFSVMGKQIARVDASKVEDRSLMELTSAFDEAMKDSQANGDKDAVDLDILHQQMLKEKELATYKMDTQQHLMVDKPGDYVDAARDTKVAKFL